MFVSEYVVGVDGCPGGWLTVSFHPGERSITRQIISNFREVRAQYPDALCIAIDIPIGLSEEGQPRLCDVEARKVLGPRRSSVFPAPDRRLLDAGSYTEANARARSLTGKGISKQTFALIPKIAEVDSVLTPELQTQVVEVHPEVCFWALAGGQPMAHRKANSEGYEERRRALCAALEGVAIPDFKEAKNLAPLAEAHDVLDAIAAAWTAWRLAQGKAGRLPSNPPTDPKGLRQEMVY
jgi:predicted RNase H-like nuclease